MLPEDREESRGLFITASLQVPAPLEEERATWSTFTWADYAADTVRQVFQHGSIGKGSLLFKRLTLNMLIILLKIF